MCCRGSIFSVTWKIILTVLLFILWSYAVFLCMLDIKETWQKGYGRITYMIGFSILPPSIPAIPLLVLPVLICMKKKIFVVTTSLVVLAVTTFCVCLSMAIIQEQSLGGLEKKLVADLRQKYGHGVSNDLENLVFTESMDYAQYTFQCCGVRNDDDYGESNWYNDESGRTNIVPPSCCVPETQTSKINISHSGTPVNVVLRVFYGMLEEGWQNPRPRNEKDCQLKSSITSRYTTGCLDSIQEWFRLENMKAILLDGILLGLEVITIIYCLLMPRNRENVQGN